MWHVYILECSSSGQFYTGITDDLDRRFEEHRTGHGGHYTSYSKPIAIVYSEMFESRDLAEDREKQIKRWSRLKKMALIKHDYENLKLLSKSRD